VAAIVSVRQTSVIALLTVAMLVAAPVVRVAFAGLVWDAIQCCCGVHAGDHDCGCPDCPAGKPDPAQGGDRGDTTPTVRPCGANAEWVSPATIPPFVAPTAPALIVPARRALAIPDADHAPPARVVVPVTPPS
jgi:hypothetical protein